MENEFNYIDFINRLRFQARGVVPEHCREHEIYIRDTLYKMAMLAGKQLANEDIDEDRSMYIIQIIAEWTFHKTVDLLTVNIPKKYHHAVLCNVNGAIYEYLMDTADSPTEPKVLNRVEKLVQKAYEQALTKLLEDKVLDKDEYSAALNYSNIDVMSGTEVCPSFSISIFEVLTATPYESLCYIISMPIIYAFVILAFMHQDFIIGVVALIFFVGILYRFITKKRDVYR